MIYEREFKKTLYRYDSETGQIWLLLRGNDRKRKEPSWKETALSIDHPSRSTFHRVVNMKGRVIGAHRLAWFIVKGYWPIELDHKNRDGIDNRWTNLREVPSFVNAHNKVVRKDSKSGIKGVIYNEKDDNWEACLKVQGQRHRKTFKNKEDAIEYRKKLEVAFADVTQTPTQEN